MKILVVDDLDTVRMIVSELLGRRGHTVATAANGIDAIDALERAAFDVVLLDLQMPGLSGIETAGMIRATASKTNRSIAILGMTASDGNTEYDRCVAAGMDGCITKLFETDAFSNAVESLGRKAADRRPPVEKNAKGKNSPSDVLARLTTRYGDETLAGELFDAFVREAPGLLARIDAAVTSGDYAKIATTAHAFKGAASTMTLDEAAAIAKTIEEAAEGQNIATISDLVLMLRQTVEHTLIYSDGKKEGA